MCGKNPKLQNPNSKIQTERQIPNRKQVLLVPLFRSPAPGLRFCSLLVALDLDFGIWDFPFPLRPASDFVFSPQQSPSVRRILGNGTR